MVDEMFWFIQLERELEEEEEKRRKRGPHEGADDKTLERLMAATENRPATQAEQ